MWLNNRETRGFTLAFPCIDGVYLPKHESEFVHLVLEELDAFEKEEQRNRVLLFPPLSSRLRYLTHRAVEERTSLCSFSVGEGLLRRVAVCSCHIRGEVKDDSDLESGALHEEEKEKESLPKRTREKNRTQKRPDQPLYLPRAVRERQRGGAGAGGGDRGVKEEAVRERQRGDRRGRVERGADTTVREGGVREERQGAEGGEERLEEERGEEGVKERGTEREEERGEGGEKERLKEETGEGGVKERLKEETGEGGVKERGAEREEERGDEGVKERGGQREEERTEFRNVNSNLDGTLNLEKPPEENQEVWDENILRTETRDWTVPDLVLDSAPDSAPDLALDSALDLVSLSCESENTGVDSDTEEINQEVRAHLKVGVSFAVDSVLGDFSCFESVALSTEAFTHVIEIYNFPALFQTQDLLDTFSQYSEEGMKIKWVDNTHALGIFSCEAAALQALSISHPLLKTRPLSQGSSKAKSKALRRAEFLQPVKERPRTDCAVARRMVTRALGLQRRGPRY